MVFWSKRRRGRKKEKKIGESIDTGGFWKERLWASFCKVWSLWMKCLCRLHCSCVSAESSRSQHSKTAISHTQLRGGNGSREPKRAKQIGINIGLFWLKMWGWAGGRTCQRTLCMDRFLKEQIALPWGQKNDQEKRSRMLTVTIQRRAWKNITCCKWKLTDILQLWETGGFPTFSVWHRESCLSGHSWTHLGSFLGEGSALAGEPLCETCMWTALQFGCWLLREESWSCREPCFFVASWNTRKCLFAQMAFSCPLA